MIQPKKITFDETTDSGILATDIYSGNMGTTPHARYMGKKRLFQREDGSILDDPENIFETDEPDYTKPHKHRVRRQRGYRTRDLQKSTALSAMNKDKIKAMLKAAVKRKQEKK